MNTAESRIIAAFTFIVALLLGVWGVLERLVTIPLPFTSVDDPFIIGLFLALVPIAATGVAWQATNASTVPWARTLGGAAVMLGILSTLGALLNAVSAG